MLPNLISKIAIAPMIDWTNTHFRVFMRILAPNALLYTEMQTIGAILHNKARALDFDPSELPLALQLGGSDKNALADAARLAEIEGYSEVNLNVGCPSDKVQKGQFGACLMATPKIVTDCIKAMKDRVSIPVTVKSRIGIDNQDSYEFFSEFALGMVNAGCDKLIVHARKAWLHGLNPKQNRTIPPLHYDYVYKIKQNLINTPVVINGNILTLQDITTHLNHVDGVMLGRLACQNPYAIALLHHALFNDDVLIKRSEAIEKYFIYIQSVVDSQQKISLLLKPIFNMAYALQGAKAWKTQLMTIISTKSLEKLQDAIDLLKDLETQGCITV